MCSGPVRLQDSLIINTSGTKRCLRFFGGVGIIPKKDRILLLIGCGHWIWSPCQKVTFRSTMATFKIVQNERSIGGRESVFPSIYYTKFQIIEQNMIYCGNLRVQS